MDTLALLKSVAVFSALDERILADIARQLKEVTCGSGASLFRQGDPADSFYIIDSGEVVIAKQLGAGREKVLAVLGPGNVFGEMAFFSDSPRTANALAKTDCVLRRIEKSSFTAFITAEPAAGVRILSGLLQVAMDRLEQTSRELTTVYQTGTIISSGKSLDAICQSVRDELLLAVPEAENGVIFLYNQFNEEFSPSPAQNGIGDIAKTHPVIARIADKTCGLAVAGGTNESGLDFLAPARSAIFAPIVRDASLLGFIVLWRTASADPLKRSYCLLAASVAGQLAEAIENIRHQQEERDRQRLNDARQHYA